MPSIFSNLSALNIRSNNNMVDETKPLLGVSSRDLVSWYGSGGGLGGYYFSLNNYPTFMLGAWTHICYSIDVKGATTVGSQTVHTFDAKVYINGVPHITVTDGVTTNGSSSTALWVGNLSSRLRPFCGALDEVRVFDSAFTAEQVAAEYARIFACHARLVARWPLDTFSERDAGGSYTSPLTAGFMAGLGDGYDMTFNDHTCVTNGPAGTTAVHFDGTATLRGKVAADGNSVAAAYAGEVAWTQVPGPATATFARAGRLTHRRFSRRRSMRQAATGRRSRSGAPWRRGDGERDDVSENSQGFCA